MSAEEPREAARLMRERARAMPDWNWTGGHLWITDHDPSDATGETPMQVAVGGADDPWATYIASWHPAVALAVADWLDRYATIEEQNHHDAGWSPLDTTEALTVARAYLGQAEA